MSVPASPESEDKRAIYVGNLPIGITEGVLQDIFSTTGSIHSIKLIGKSTLNAVNYAFVEYDDPASATVAIEIFNGRAILGSPIKVNWAYTSFSSAAAREATSTHFSIFVGDLAVEIDDSTLYDAFSRYQSLSDARIMWDMSTGRSRGYGFCSFETRADAEAAVREMQGHQLGSRAIRCNWANLKLSTSPIEALLINPNKQQLQVDQQYLLVLSQTPQTVSTVYLGNLSFDINAEVLESLFDVYGGAKEVKLHADRGFAFVRLASHDSAALAIVQLQGTIVNGRPIKMSCKSISQEDMEGAYNSDQAGQNKADAKTRQRSTSAAALAAVQQSHFLFQGPLSQSTANTRLASSDDAHLIPRHFALPIQQPFLSDSSALALQGTRDSSNSVQYDVSKLWTINY